MTFAPDNSAKILRSGRTTTVVRPGFRRPLPHALSARSCTHFGGGSCCTFASVIVIGAQVNGRGLANRQRTQVVLFFWFGWGGVVPPVEGARLPLYPAQLICSACGSCRSPSHSVCVHTNTEQTPGATPGGTTNERHTPMNPVDKLLKKDEHREAMLRALGSAHTALDDAIANYRTAFKTATTIGWPKADLTKAGFPDPIRLPKATTRTPDAEA